MRGKSKYFLYVFISFVLHGSMVFFSGPLIEKNSIPVFTSWLSLLSKDDLYYREGKKKSIPKELILSFSSKNYVLSLLRDTPPSILFRERSFFKQEVKDIKRKEDFYSFSLKEEMAPFIDLVGVECRRLDYKAEISPKGRVTLVSPLTLPINSSMGSYLEGSLREKFFPLGKGNFFWTKVRMMVK